ncbi:transposase [Nonomuraea sp. NPDC002799]
MSLRPRSYCQVPEETARVARAALPGGSPAIRIRDALGVIYEDEQFEDLFSSQGQPALSPGRLAMVLVMQFSEGLPDRQAAEAVRARIDWKYALGLDLADPGFDFSVLSEFRTRLVAGNCEQQILDTVLERAAEAGLLKTAGRARTDSTHVLAAIRDLNRLELAGETLPVKAECTRSRRRRLTLRPQAEHEVLAWARAEQHTDQWKSRYQARQGIEGTIAQGVKVSGLRRSCYRGTAKTHLQHLLIAAAMNVTRLDAWLLGTPLAPTRTSHFAALRPAA